MILSIKKLSNQIGVGSVRMIDKAVILAAGMGRRLKPLTDHAPKCLTEVHGTPILINTLKGLSSAGIRVCTIVVGYFSSAIEKLMGSRFKNVELKYVYNRDFENTNDMYSLWLAAEMLEQGVLLFEGDIFFSYEMLHRVLSHIGSRSCYVAGDYDGRTDEVVVTTDRNLRIKSVDVLSGCGIEIVPNRFISAGILVLQQRYAKKLSSWLSEFVRDGKTDLLFDAVIAEHLNEAPLYVSRIGHHEWVEIDKLGDLEKAENTFTKPVQS
jgi:CTP:phosphocholine cytidylyltransferase-like protein